MMPDYVIGLDLGQVNDFTALAVLERPGASADGAGPVYALRHLQRFRLGTPYPQLVPAVGAIISRSPLAGRSTLVVDQTGVGRAVVDLFRVQPLKAPMIPVTITSGQRRTVKPDGSHHVPKKELVTCLQSLLQSQRLRMARKLPDAQVLVKELLDFRVRITEAANETFGAWRNGQHDDLVLAVALACWQAERRQPTAG